MFVLLFTRIVQNLYLCHAKRAGHTKGIGPLLQGHLVLFLVLQRYW